MSGYARDLAAIDPWEASLQRSRARRQRSAPMAVSAAPRDRQGLARIPRGAIDARREAARDLSDREPWELSLGRSRARRRAAQLRFVPNSTRARRASLGALIAVAAAPGRGAAGVPGAPDVGVRVRRTGADDDHPALHHAAQRAAKAARCACSSGRSVSTSTASTVRNRGGGAPLPGEPRPEGRRRRWAPPRAARSPQRPARALRRGGLRSPHRRNPRNGPRPGPGNRCQLGTRTTAAPDGRHARRSRGRGSEASTPAAAPR